MDMNYTAIAVQLSWHYGVIILNMLVIAVGSGVVVGITWGYISLAKWSTRFIRLKYMDALNEILGKDGKKVKA